MAITRVNSEHFSFNIPNSPVGRPILEKALGCIDHALSEKNIKKTYKFSVLKPDGQFLLLVDINLYKEIAKPIDVLGITLLSFEDTQDVFRDPPTEEEFLNTLKTFPCLSEEEEKPSVTLPNLYRPSAPPAWLNKLQSHLEYVMDLRWINKINSDALGKQLANPTELLATVFNEKLPVYTIHEQHEQNNTAFQKIVDWISFTQKVLSLSDPSAKLEMIKKHNLGAVLTQITELLHYIPQNMIVDDIMPALSGEVLLLSIQVLKAMSYSYFFSTNQEKEAFKGPREDAIEKVIPSSLKESLKLVCRDHKSVVAAWDSSQRKLTYSQSGRLWDVFPKEIESWKKAQTDCSARFKKESPLFTRIVAENLILQILLETASSFSEFCESSHMENKALANVKTVCGDFAKFLGDLHKTRSASYRMRTISVVYDYFTPMFTPDVWQDLFSLFQTDEVSQESLLEIVFRQKYTRHQLAAMSLCHLPCGETKTALDYCKRLPLISEKAREALPNTLRERIHFSAVHVKEKSDKWEFTHLPVCHKCHDLWPVYEALYWSIRQTGISLTFIEQLNKLLRTTHQKSKAFIPNS